MKKQYAIWICFGLFLIFILFGIWWTHQPSSKILSGIRSVRNGCGDVVLNAGIQLGIPKEDGVHQVLLDWRDVNAYFEKGYVRGDGVIAVTVDNQEEPTMHSVRWQDVPIKDGKSNQNMYYRYLSENQSGILKDRLVGESDLFSCYTWLQDHVRQWSWEKSSDRSLTFYSTKLSATDTVEFVEHSFPSAFAESYVGQSVLTVGLDNQTGYLVSVGVKSESKETSDVGLLSFSCSMELESQDMKQMIDMESWEESALGSRDSFQSLNDVLLVRSGFSLPDIEDWKSEQATLSKNAPVLSWNDHRIGMVSDTITDIKLLNDVLTGVTADGTTQMSMKIVSQFDGLDTVNAYRSAADSYYRSEKEKGLLKEVNIEDVQMTNLREYQVYWYREQYTDCSESQNGTAVMQAYHFYVDLGDFQCLSLELLEVSDIASHGNLSKTMAFDILSDVVIEK